MPEQLLHRANVVPIFKETRRERMTHRVRADAFRDARQSRRFGKSLLHDGLVQMIPGRRSKSWSAANPSRRKHELPSPVSRRVGEFAIQCKGQDDAPEPARQVPLMQPPHVSQVPGSTPPSLRPAARHPILLALALPHDDLVAIEIEVLDPQSETLLQPDPRSVQHHDD